MKIIKMYQDRLKKITLCDISCIKIATAAATLLLAKFYPDLLMLKWQCYLIIALVASAKPVLKILSK